MTNQTLAEIVDLFLLRCEVEETSPRTVSAYRWTLRRFLAAIEADGAPERAALLEREHIYRYLRRFAELRSETRHRYFREVRCCFNWLVEAGYMERFPFRGIRNVRLPQRVVQPFSPNEVARLLAACDESPVNSGLSLYRPDA